MSAIVQVREKTKDKGKLLVFSEGGHMGTYATCVGVAIPERPTLRLFVIVLNGKRL